jgi:hypothetical protein
MLAILDESLAAELEGGGPRANSVLAALTICAQQVREGTHILFSERVVYRRLRAFHHLLDARTTAVLVRSEERLPQLGQIRDFTERAVRIVVLPPPAASSRVVNGRRVELLLPATAIEHESSLLSSPMLLVENLNDGRCYLKLVQSIVESSVMPDLDWLRAVPLRCEIVPGGGNTLGDLFAYQKGEARRLGAAIADSDCRYPGSALGHTAAALVRVATAAPVSPLLEHHVLDVRAIENCIPRAELRRVAEELDPVQVHRLERIRAVFETSPFWKVVPIKSGVRCFDLGQVSAESQFWTALFGGRRCQPAAQCSKKSECAAYAIPPLSDQVLARSVAQAGLFAVTERCMEGLADTWRRLVVLLYSLFCGSERVTVL